MGLAQRVSLLDVDYQRGRLIQEQPGRAWAVGCLRCRCNCWPAPSTSGLLAAVQNLQQDGWVYWSLAGWMCRSCAAQFAVELAEAESAARKEG